MPPAPKNVLPVASGPKAVGARQPVSKDTSLSVRFDREAKSLVQRAAAVRELTVSDYVRTRILPLA